MFGSELIANFSIHENTEFLFQKNIFGKKVRKKKKVGFKVASKMQQAHEATKKDPI